MDCKNCGHELYQEPDGSWLHMSQIGLDSCINKVCEECGCSNPEPCESSAVSQ